MTVDLCVFSQASLFSPICSPLQQEVAILISMFYIFLLSPFGHEVEGTHPLSLKQ